MNTISFEQCPCGHTGCSDYHLVDIGHFCQGSGFSLEEAEQIRDLVNKHKTGIFAEIAVKGQRVRYIPDHAHGWHRHPECEDGVIKRMASNIVSPVGAEEPLPAAFVLYDNLDTKMTTGDEPYKAKRTRLENLILI